MRYGASSLGKSTHAKRQAAVFGTRSSTSLKRIAARVRTERVHGLVQRGALMATETVSPRLLSPGSVTAANTTAEAAITVA